MFKGCAFSQLVINGVSIVKSVKTASGLINDLTNEVIANKGLENRGLANKGIDKTNLEKIFTNLFTDIAIFTDIGARIIMHCTNRFCVFRILWLYKGQYRRLQ